MSKCKYYRESSIEQYTPECTGDTDSVHPSDAEDWIYCPYCGNKIKLKDNCSIPEHLIEDNDY